ncbi:amidohydrolase family protein, partial [Maribacter sp.]|nr:amidohydrolase family protein [Maribacter sp.]
LQNVHIIDVRNGQLLSDRAILVSDGKIQSILPTKELDPTAFSKVIDAKGGYVIPGLWDMHAHLRANNLPPELITDWMMPLFIANGVTGVREMTSSCEREDQGPVCLDQMRAWQKEIDLGTLDGPRLLSLSSFQLNSPREQDYTKKEIQQMVATFDAQEINLIKVYTDLSPKAYHNVMQEAKKYTIPVGGHIPLRMTISEASAKGLRSLEHARDFLFDCFPGSKAFRKSARSQDPPIATMHEMVNHFDAEKCQRIFQVMLKNETWYVPTHLTRRMEAFADKAAFLNDDRNQYIPKMLLHSWKNDAERVVAKDTSAYGRAAYMKFYRKGLEITGKAHKAGVRILVGTDGGDSFVHPGFSVHNELGELVKAGLTPLEALQAATLHSAEFLHLQKSFGSITVGKNADFIVLENNPLVAIENTKTMQAVIYRGDYFTRDQLNALLDKAKNFKL